MYGKLVGDARLYRALQWIDEDLAATARAGDCLLCGAVLHSARYPRKPRGGPESLGPDYGWRLSFCCAAEGCRRRLTPPSVRFLGRRVYLATVVVLVGALTAGVTAARLRRLRSVLGVGRRTLERWRRWWLEAFPASRFWRRGRGRFSPPVAVAALPRSLLDRFAGRRARDRLASLLRWLSPITTRPPAGAGYVVDV